LKGVELLASVLGLLMMIGIAAFLGGIMIFVISAAHQPSASKITYEMFLSPIYPPIKYETMLLSYLESTETASKIPIKKILVYAAYQKKVDSIFIDGANVTTLGDSSVQIFNNWLQDEFYILILNVDGNEYTIASNRRALVILPDNMEKIKKISVPLYVDSKSFVLVNDKTRELPLSITLDLYVQ
jgi:hypothetical protein